MKVRTRIAPSPTGYPHIGTIYQALFDYAFAKKYNGQFLVRIEDTDRTRFVVDAEDSLFAALDWFKLQEDESPRKGGSYGSYRQSERLSIYQKYAEELIEKKHAYYCFCTPERLDEMRKKLQQEKKPLMYDKYCRALSQAETDKKLEENTSHVIRMIVPDNKTIIIRDEIRGDITFESNIIDDQVLLKSDGFPTYHLAVVVDDHMMEITHIVRAEEWISSTPKHYLLYEYFGWEKPLFFHTSLLRNPDKSKLSKRHGHTNVSWYIENGYLPEAILNFLALLGWSHPEGKEIFSLDVFISLVELSDLKPVAPIFDLTKLTWMNQQYIQHLADDDLLNRLEKFYVWLRKDDLETVKKLLPLLRDRMQTLKDFEILAGHFFKASAAQITDKKEEIIREDLRKNLSNIENWQTDAILKVLKSVLTTYNIRMPVLYRFFTGNEKGLPLPESLEILGKEKTLNRIASFNK